MALRLTLAALGWLALLWVALRPVLRKEDFSERQARSNFAAFCLGLPILLLLARWQSLTFPGEINVDEGTTIAFGLKYLHDPIPWRSVDGMTCGPLSAWVNLWAPFLGFKLSYIILRLTSLVLIFATIVATALSTREMVGPKYGLLCVFPALTLLASTLHPDFVTAAQEYLPVAMASLAIFLILSDYRSPRAPKVFFVGLITGAMPFSKLQAAPSAVALFLICAGLLFRTRRESRSTLWKHLAWLAFGGLTVPILILVPVMFAGAWPEFVNLYLLSGASYRYPTSLLSTLDFLVVGNGDFGVYWVASLAAIVVFLWFVQKRADLREWRIGSGILAAYVGILLFSVLRSGFNFPHYLILLVIPATLATCWVLRAFLSFPSETSAPRRPVLVLTVFALFTVLQAGNAGLSYPEELGILGDGQIEEDKVVPILSRYARSGDSMAMWGRLPRLHAMTGIRPGTRFVDSAYMIDPSPKYDRYRRLYLEDFKRDRPRLFVDACDEFRRPDWPAGTLLRHEMLPELAEVIRHDYSLVAEVQLLFLRQPLRVYVRNGP